MVDLHGKVALVTGSSSGIGEAIARGVAARGAKVVVNSTSSVTAGERVAGELRDATYVQADIADPNDAARLVAAAVERYGRLDILVNNAGTTETVPHHELNAATFEVWGRRTVVTSLFVDGHEALEDIARFVGPAKPSTAAGYVKRLGRRPRPSPDGLRRYSTPKPRATHRLRRCTKPSSVIRRSCHPNERLRIHPGVATLIAFWSAATRSRGVQHPADSTSSQKANLQLLVQLADTPRACPAVVTVAAEVPR
jgi:NAD(P)-dependent dehydrogenase (short-subunit alcohol dehydrogenase family)